MADNNLYNFKAKTLAGDPSDLNSLRGKLVLVVNTASECGFTPQYAGLEELHRRYGDKGLAVLGFPCNQFAGQEPGSDADVKAFCTTSYGVTFPMFSKIDVNGTGKAPLYAWLTEQAAQPDGPGDIKWNFAKFLVDRRGNVVARFDPKTSPAAPDVRQAIERALS